jgi:hypothetical protein
MPIYGKGYAPWANPNTLDPNCDNINTVFGTYSLSPIQYFYPNDGHSYAFDETKKVPLNNINDTTNNTSLYGLGDGERGIGFAISAADQFDSVVLNDAVSPYNCDQNNIGYCIYGDAVGDKTP